MIQRVLPCVVVVWALMLWATAGWAQSKCNDNHKTKTGKGEGPKPTAAEVLPPDKMSETRHVLRFEDTQIRYGAVAGTLPVQVRKEGPECRMFFISYAIEAANPASRPLTFVFNGGPGASSAYLHLAAIGPKSVVFGLGGAIPDPPPRMAENVYTWLRFTDLVFVDPVGTGYSRCMPVEKQEANKEAETEAWGVEEDFTAVAKFIRLYLTRKGRWMSPKFLAGESYGGFRVAGLSEMLQSDYGIGVNGMVLISPALEFGVLDNGQYGLLPWMARVPSYAAAARRHGKAQGELPEENLRKGLKGVEHFAVNTLLPALADVVPDAISAQLADYIGVGEPWVRRVHARVPLFLYVKRLLSPSHRLISVYDGSWTAIDPDPASPFPSGEDPLLVRINLLLTPAFNTYIREDLGFETDFPYKILNKAVSQKWNWDSGLKSGQGFVGAAEDLKASMSVNENLKVLIAHGVFDLVTPYFGSVVIVRQMGLDPAIGPNLNLRIYPGGHMFYTHQKARAAFFEDVRQFFTAALP